MDAFTPPTTNTDPPDRFPTKTGWCIVTPDRLQLVHAGARGAVARMLVGHSPSRARLFPRLVAFALLGTACLGLLQGQLVVGVSGLLFGGSLLWMSGRQTNLSVTPEIPFSDIRRIEAFPPLPGVARPYLKVIFDEQGSERLRYVHLPSAVAGGDQAFERAKALLRAADLPLMASGTARPPPRRS